MVFSTNSPAVTGPFLDIYRAMRVVGKWSENMGYSFVLFSLCLWHLIGKLQLCFNDFTSCCFSVIYTKKVYQTIYMLSHLFEGPVNLMDFYQKCSETKCVILFLNTDHYLHKLKSMLKCFNMQFAYLRSFIAFHFLSIKIKLVHELIAGQLNTIKAV